MSVKIKVCLKNAEFENYRIFDKLNIEFHPKLTVLIGKNGAGKTALLEGIIPLLTPLVQRIKNEPISFSKVVKRSDVKNGRLEFINTLNSSMEVRGLDITISNDHQSTNIVQESGANYGDAQRFDLNWFATYNTDAESEIDSSDALSLEILQRVFSSVTKLIKINSRPDVKQKDEIELPLVAYYPCAEGQEWMSYVDDKNDDSNGLPIFNAYDQSLTRRSFDYKKFLSWFKYREGIARQQENQQDVMLEAVRLAIYSMLNDDLEGGDYYNLQVKYTEFDEEGELEIQKRKLDKPVKVSQMSSGEKTLFALVSDLARRLCRLNPYHTNPLEGNGIVLIDEVDLHLHPEWQRKVIPQLQKTFPNIQFVVTTHSPGVLQNVPKESVRVIVDGTVSDEPLYTLGRDIKSIYFDAFDQSEYPEEQFDMINKVRKIYALIRKKGKENLDEAESLIDTLELDWGPEDRKIVELKKYLNLNKL